MIRTTCDVREANLVTHAGIFHADEVMATVILSKVLGDVTVYRTFDLPDNLTPDVIVYDIGDGEFGLYPKGKRAIRENGIPYASTGLIWSKYGRRVVKDTAYPNDVWYAIERKLIQGIDATDSGTMPFVDYPTYPMIFSQIISDFNPTWDSEEATDAAFLRATKFAEAVFDNVFNQAAAKTKAKDIVEKAICEADGPIMVLDGFVPWKDYVLFSKNKKAEKIQFAVYPSNRGGYCWHCVPDASKREGNNRASYRIPRKATPEEWKGLRNRELQMVTGIRTAIFCHEEGWMGRTQTLEDAIAMARLAADS